MNSRFPRPRLVQGGVGGESLIFHAIPGNTCRWVRTWEGKVETATFSVQLLWSGTRDWVFSVALASSIKRAPAAREMQALDIGIWACVQWSAEGQRTGPGHWKHLLRLIRPWTFPRILYLAQIQTLFQILEWIPTNESWWGIATTCNYKS